VTNFRVAHILIGGQTHSGTVCLYISVGAGSKQMIQRRGICNFNSIAAAAVALAHAVHNYQYNGFFHRLSLPPKTELIGNLKIAVLLFYNIYVEDTSSFFLFSNLSKFWCILSLPQGVFSVALPVIVKVLLSKTHFRPLFPRIFYCSSLFFMVKLEKQDSFPGDVF
jgi:hypothetical protein